MSLEVSSSKKSEKCPVLVQQEENVNFLLIDSSRVVDKFFKTSVERVLNLVYSQLKELPGDVQIPS